tara:strand:+ start:443 stop:1747 length:1305 start_codon:yes stop_codon:yes gene_type:complete
MSLTKASYSVINGAPINVLDYGAVGDGSADDSDAIQAAINAAAVRNQLLYFPTNSYRVTKTLTMYSGTTITGDQSWAYAASYGLTYASEIRFEPTTPDTDLFIIGDNPNIPSPPAFYSKISICNLILLGNGDTNSRFALDLNRAIYCNFENLTITEFQYPVRCTTTIKNCFTNLLLTATRAAARYSGLATTDVWSNCTFFGGPIGVQTVGPTVGIRFNNCLFEQLENYGADIVKDTESMSFINCYSEDVPYTAGSTNCMFRVGLDGAALSTENQLTVIGGNYQGRNAGVVGSWMDVDYCSGILVSAVNVSRYTNVINTTANTVDNSIFVSGINGIGYTNYSSGAADKISGLSPATVLNSGSFRYNLKVAAVVASSSITSAIYTNNGVEWAAGAYSPEGTFAAPVGSLWSNKAGGAGTSFYVKESGTGNTGWVAK